MSACPDCGFDHHAESEAALDAADATVEAAQIQADATVASMETTAEINVDDNDTREAIARVEADAAVAQTQILADAAVEIAQAEADADVAVAAALDEPDELDVMPPEGADVVLTDDELVVDQADEPAAESTPINVPPQIVEDAPTPAGATSRARSGFHSGRRRR